MQHDPQRFHLPPINRERIYRESKRDAWAYITSFVGVYLERPDLTEAERAAIRMAWGAVWAADYELRRGNG